MENMVEKVMERFLRYVKYETDSNENSNSFPSTPGQLIFAGDLAKELENIGLADVSVDDNGYVTATLPSNVNRNTPVIGFIAHMDTSPDMPGKNVNPQIIENYDGSDIVLNKEKNIILSSSDFPGLKEYTGETIITTDGTTLLGADDKAGISEIITACEYLVQHPEIEHGTIKICFTPDEEIGRGADRFPLAEFNADFAYTVDAGGIGIIQFENFNAANARIIINGKNVHPGTAKNKMKNSLLIGAELVNLLPSEETPAHTEGYEGFYHLNSFNGNVESTSLTYIIRDFDMEKLAGRKYFLQDIVNGLNKKYGKGTIEIQIKDSYFNMREIIEKNMHTIDIAHKAMGFAGIKTEIKPIRGGTDGARLSFMGLPTPNIFTGGHNYHGKYEYIPAGSMGKAVEVLIKIAQLGIEGY